MLSPAHKRFAGALIASCILLSLSATAAFATVARYMDLPSLVKISDVIVQGKAIKQKQLYDKTRKLPLLQTTIQVQQVHMGKTTSKTVVIQQIGGTHEGVTTKIAGDAKFEMGEEVIVFLKKGTGNLHFLNAMGQAKYTVSRVGNKVTIARDLTGFAFVKPGETNITPITEAQLKMTTFEARLKAAIKKVKGDTK